MDRASGIGQRGQGQRTQGGPRARKAAHAHGARSLPLTSPSEDDPVSAREAAAPPQAGGAAPHKATGSLPRRLGADPSAPPSSGRHSRSGLAREGEQPLHLYAIGIGSNRPLSGVLSPRAIVEAALVALDLPPFSLLARAPVIETAPIGPSLRRYANSAALVASHLTPLAMLDRLQALERQFGRRRFRRWGDRTLDLDMLLWSGGRMESRRLTVPHPLLRERAFALAPLARIAPRWRDPATGLTMAQLAARLARRRPLRPEAG